MNKVLVGNCWFDECCRTVHYKDNKSGVGLVHDETHGTWTAETKADRRARVVAVGHTAVEALELLKVEIDRVRTSLSEAGSRL